MQSVLGTEILTRSISRNRYFWTQFAGIPIPCDDDEMSATQNVRRGQVKVSQTEQLSHRNGDILQLTQTTCKAELLMMTIACQHRQNQYDAPMLQRAFHSVLPRQSTGQDRRQPYIQNTSILILVWYNSLQQTRGLFFFICWDKVSANVGTVPTTRKKMQLPDIGQLWWEAGKLIGCMCRPLRNVNMKRFHTVRCV